MSFAERGGLSRLDEDRAASMADEGGCAGARANAESERTVYDVMSEPVVVVGPDVPLAEAAREMRDLEVDVLPIEDRDRLVGIVTDRDMLRDGSEGRNPSGIRVGDVMTCTVICCHEQDDVRDAALLMHDHGLHNLLVLDSSERIIGVVREADLEPH